MVFTEPRFLLFYAVAFALAWAIRSHWLHKAWLLLCSYVFYAAWDWRFLFLIAGSTFVDWLVGLGLERTRSQPARRTLLVLTLLANLGMVGLFKYYDFFVTSGASLLSALGLHVEPRTLGLVLPVGISFYTFQSLSYTIDVYRRQLRANRSLLDFALFVSFFTHLVAGPIVRAANFLPQFATRPRWSDVKVRPQLWLILAGFVKKACVSDNVSPVVDAIFANPGAYGPADQWLGTVLYALQIYCDFSGYTDMAIGTAGLLGYKLALNFDFPYLARTITDFWRRWHISLSTWFRDYLYIPLGGARRGPARTYFNLLVVFFLCGLWHGAAWRFVVWGLWHGAVLVVERVLRIRDSGATTGGPLLGRLLGHASVALVVLVGWVFFRATDVPAALHMLAGMFGVESSDATQLVRGAAWWWAGVALFLAAHVAARRRLFAARLSAWPDAAFSVAYGVAVALVLPWVATDYQPFIYFQF